MNEGFMLHKDSDSVYPFGLQDPIESDENPRSSQNSSDDHIDHWTVEDLTGPSDELH